MSMNCNFILKKVKKLVYKIIQILLTNSLNYKLELIDCMRNNKKMKLKFKILEYI